MKDFEFKVNNHLWKVEIKEEKELFEKQNNPDITACFGLTLYKEHKILITKELCEDEKIRTLKHELTHCFVWEYGFYNVSFDGEEFICDFVSSITEFIIYVLKKGGILNV